MTKKFAARRSDVAETVVSKAMLGNKSTIKVRHLYVK
jgi:hypothetical protein